MRIAVALLSVLLPTSLAFANPAIDNVAKTVAPKAVPFGQPIEGSQADANYDLLLTAGKCYWLIGRAEGAKVLHMWMHGPNGKKRSEMKADTPSPTFAYCTDIPGNHRLLVKVRPPMPYTIKVFAEDGHEHDISADGRRQNNPNPPAAAGAAGGAPVSPSVIDDGPTHPGGNAALQVACDCGAMEIYLDGALHNVQSGSYRIGDLGAGQHTLKIMGWSGPFSRKKFYEGAINLHPDTESRIAVNKQGARLMGKNPVPPPAPVAKQASDRTYSEIDAATDLVHDARELAREERCGRRLDDKFQNLADTLSWARQNVSIDALNTVQVKMQDVADYAQDSCGGRAGGNVSRKLGRVRARLDSAKATLE